MPPNSNPARSRNETTMDIHQYVYKNDVDSVRLCIKDNPTSMNSKDSNGKTPLIVASLFNRYEILDALLTSHSDVNSTDDDGNTALHEAVDKGNTEIVRRLLSSNWCNTNMKNKCGETPLMKASFYDYSEISRILLKDGAADPDIIDDNGQSALLIALREGSQVTVESLLKHGCNISILDSLGHSALYVAVHSPCNKTLELAKKLLMAGYDTHADKMWLINEEKHNMFYQDDDFYAHLRRNLRSLSHEHSTRSVSLNTISGIVTTAKVNNNPHVVQRAHSMKSERPPVSPFAMSPSLRQKVLSFDADKFCFPPLKFTKQSSLDSADFNTPPTSPYGFRKKSSRSSVESVFFTSNSKLTSSFPTDSDDADSPNHVGNFTQNRHTPPTAHVKPSLKISKKEEVDVSSSSSRKTSATIPVRTIATYTHSTPIPTSNMPEAGTNKLPTTNIHYIQDISMKVSEPKSDPKSDSSCALSLPCKPSVHFSTEIKVIDMGCTY